MIPDYNYRVKDFSIVTPGFRDYVVQPVMKFVPWGLPANIITIFSNSLMFLALIIAIYGNPFSKINFIAISILIFLYALGDHIDGMQAKRTKTSSALGELFDHFLDSFNTGILLMILFAVFQIHNPYIVVFILSVNYLAHATVFYEQYKTGWLYFEKIGSLEVVFFTCIMILLNCIKPFSNLFSYNMAFGITFIEWLLLASSIGTLITFIKTAYRARIKELKFYIYLLLLTLISLILVKGLSWITICVIITLYSAYYIGSLMRGHLVDGKSYLPDFAIPVILVFAFITHRLAESITIYGVILLLLFGIAFVFSISIYTLRKYWVWKNPSANRL
jgi:phosphatidylglycerophosphate synthase